MTGLWLLLALVAAVVAAPFVAEARRKPLDEARRAKAPGRFATLPMGRTHYRWQGPADGPVAVCIHGLTTPSEVFEPLIAQLTAAGFRTLSYDLPGRGCSDTARGAQGQAFFIAQLEALLTDQRIDRIDLLLGYSMGGSIATGFAARMPHRVGRLVLLASAGLLHDGGRLSEFVRRTPLLGDAVMLTIGGIQMRRSLAAGGQTPLLALQQAQTHRRGFLPGVLSSQRNMLGRDMRPAHGAIQAAGVPTLAIWGIEDTVIPVSNVGRLAEVHRAAHQATIAGATHALPYSHAPQAWAEIATFLAETTAKAKP